VEFEGFGVLALEDEAPTVLAGLQVLRRVYPRGFMRVKRCLSYVYAGPRNGYSPWDRSCSVDVRAGPDAIEIARRVLHSATVACLRPAALFYEDASDNARVARIAAREELVLLRRFAQLQRWSEPQREHFLQQWRTHLEKRVAERYWERR